MQKRHFTMLADEIAGMWRRGELTAEQTAIVTDRISTVCYFYNEAFDHARFRSHVEKQAGNAATVAKVSEVMLASAERVRP